MPSTPIATAVYAKRPDPLLEVRVHLCDVVPTARGLCTGYDRKVWRNDALADYLFEYLPDFALRYQELGPAGHDVWVPKLREAAKSVYTTDKFKRRGEFGELLLHAVIRELWETEPAVSKLYYKDGPNETVKGFDAVHVVLVPGNPLELLLGEVKFYRSIDKAMTDVAKELRDHFDNDEWLRSEFVAVTRKIDDTWPHAGELRELLHRRRTINDILGRVRVPVLLTYESPCVAKYDECHDMYCADLTAEVADLQQRFAGRNLPADVVIDLLLVPLERKANLVKALEARLKAWQLI
ncbi:MAG TPA: DUF1837 domain-containing protein [Solirubrobacteraceae bacterium]|nr:DUF1837 domain-containing protein [Solirubrobacteraceae bacterium]